METGRRAELEGQELRMGQDEAEESVTPTEPGVGMTGPEAFSEPDAAVETAVAPGEEPAEEDAAADEEEQTSVCKNSETREQTEVGRFSGMEGPVQDGAAAGAAESEGAAGGAESPEAVWRRRAEGYAVRAVFSEARASAAAMGVPENRLDNAAKLCDLSGIDPEDEGARARIAEAVRAVLRELPELRGGVGTGEAASPRRARRDAFERGFLGA